VIAGGCAYACTGFILLVPLWSSTIVDRLDRYVGSQGLATIMSEHVCV